YHDLQPVVVGRVVAAGDGDAAAAAEVVRGEVGDRRRRHADVDHVGAGGIEAFGERLGELGAGKAAVASDRERGRVALAADGAERAADVAHDGRRERLADDAADVVGAEDFCRDFHAWKCWIRRCASQGPGKPTWPPWRGNSRVTHGAALRAAASSAFSGRNGSLRALRTSVGTRMCSRYGPLAL